MTTLLVAEKPNVASKIAQALGNYSVEENYGVTNYRLDTDRGEVIIAPAVGHMFTIEQKDGEWTYPVFDIEWVPSFEADDSASYIKKYVNNMQKMAEEADEFINGCDYDIEGCLPPGETVITREDGTIRIERIGDLMARLEDERQVRQDGSFEYIETDIEITAMDDWETSFVPLERVMRRPADESVFTITTEHGRQTTVSPNHPMLVATENGLETRTADELEEGDYIPASNALPDSETTDRLDLIELLDDIYVHGFKDEMDIMPAEMAEHVDRTRKQCLNYRHHDRMPKDVFLQLEDYLGVDRSEMTISSPRGSTSLPAELVLDRQLGKIIGLYLAEGCIDTGGFIGFYLGPEEHGLAEEIQEFLLDIGTEGKFRKRAVERSYGDSNCIEVGTKSKILRMLFRALELGDDSGSKRLPSWILSAPKTFKNGLLTGYWDGDGSIFIDTNDDRAVASAGSKNRELLNDLFLLLQTDGINPSFQEWNHSDREMHNLTLGRRHDVETIASRLGVAEELPEIDAKKAQHRRRMDKLPACLAQRQELSAEAEQNLRKGTKTTSMTNVQTWQDEELAPLASGDITFLEVQSIERQEPESEHLYDVQTKTRNFAHSNGIISHNSVIGYTAIKLACNGDEDRIKRMKFSTLTNSDLREAFDDLNDFDRAQTEAGMTRHVMDWYYGINLSRALMIAVKSQDRYKSLSTGRVQGPALKIVADREREIRAFDPEDYWEVYLHAGGLEAQHVEERFWDEDEADRVVELCQDGKAAVVDVDRREYNHNPPAPFNLTDLQNEAYSKFNISPKKTQQLAQNLYESSLISYPRTSSQKLPKKIGYGSILSQLKKQDKYEDKAGTVLAKDDIYPRQGKKKDEAHPAIHPTGNAPGNLSKQERKIYDLVVKRFLATFGEPARRESLTITLNSNDEVFEAKGKRTLERNWYDLYEPYMEPENIELPDLKKGAKLDVEQMRKEDKQTKPPNRYTQSSLISELEKNDLGTKATRANIVENLYDRNYIDEKSIKVTDIGMAVVEALEEHCPEILSPELTRAFEKQMDAIRAGDKTREDVLDNAKETLTDILETFKNNENDIGEQLVEAIDKRREKERQLGPCQECDDGTLRIIKTNNGRFVGCSNYPDCENSYPLPGSGKIKGLKNACDECGKPRIKVIRKGKKPYYMCIDPDCPTKDDWD
ncbi:MAG: DNA topoisomerase I [Candidatus Nanohaloarchaea archaeon]|nr:DNA topoisomerase I [Candidatus Nanohaloarchaea archaeon]